jgi:cobalt-zinc-cadmium efflux system protein
MEQELNHRHRESGHSHAPDNYGVAFAIGTALNVGLVIAEVTFGWLSNSVALISDGVHNFSDVLGLLLAWGGSLLAGRRPGGSRTYGYRRATILAAVANAALLLAATCGLIVEAAQRLWRPEPVESRMVLAVASAAIAINLATALLFLPGRKADLNLRGAFLHMMADAAVSLAVVVAALLIAQTGRLWLDAAASLVVALVILWSGWGLMRSALDLALDAVPEGIELSAVENYLASLPGVRSVHDLHVWGISTTETALTAHLVRPDFGVDDAFLAEVAHELERRFGIGHATIQVEAGILNCSLASTDVA